MGKWINFLNSNKNESAVEVVLGGNKSARITFAQERHKIVSRHFNLKSNRIQSHSVFRMRWKSSAIQVNVGEVFNGWKINCRWWLLCSLRRALKSPHYSLILLLSDCYVALYLFIPFIIISVTKVKRWLVTHYFTLLIVSFATQCVKLVFWAEEEEEAEKVGVLHHHCDEHYCQRPLICVSNWYGGVAESESPLLSTLSIFDSH